MVFGSVPQWLRIALSWKGRKEDVSVDKELLDGHGFIAMEDTKIS
jgi:hypothetical protein